MVIIDFIEILNRLPDDFIIEGVKPLAKSDRGDYYKLCLIEDKSSQSTVKELSDYLKSAIGKEFAGYKGGEYLMEEWSDLTFGDPHCGGYDIDGILINYEGAKIKVLKMMIY